MDPAHLTRFHFIYMKEDRLDWLKWARKMTSTKYVIRFLGTLKSITPHAIAPRTVRSATFG